MPWFARNAASGHAAAARAQRHNCVCAGCLSVDNCVECACGTLRVSRLRAQALAALQLSCKGLGVGGAHARAVESGVQLLLSVEGA